MPEPVPPPVQGRPNELTRFTARMHALTSTAAVPGISVAVSRADRLLYARGFGLADRDAGRPATTRTSYLWFSMTKIATATAALRLADEGRLDLAAPVTSFVRGYPSAGDSRVTVGDLLNHTAGVANPVPVRWVRPVDRPEPDPEEFLQRRLARHRRPRFPVGGPARYSNLGYLILGEVIHRAAGQPFREYVRDSVLRPAGMTRTDFGYQDEVDRAVGYVRAPRGAGPVLRALLPAGIVGGRSGPFLSFEPFLVNGAAYGGLVGDVIDASRLAALHLADGVAQGNRILRAETARGMRDIRTPGKPFDLGQGWFRKPEHRTCSPSFVEHYGSGGGFFNAMRLYPELDLGIVLMANTTRPYDVHTAFETLRQVPWDDLDPADGMNSREP